MSLYKGQFDKDMQPLAKSNLTSSSVEKVEILCACDRYSVLRADPRHLVLEWYLQEAEKEAGS